MKVIQELIAYFDRRGKLTPSQLTKLLQQGLLASDAPENLVSLCEVVGQTYYFRVHGEERGTVWGTDIYTGDSALCAAAVHAGAVDLGETAVVKVTVVTPPPRFLGCTRHGITTQSYGPFRTAYQVSPV
jgi:hypothetical protein